MKKRSISLNIFLAVLAVLALLYPIAVYWGIQHFEPRYIGIAVVFIYTLRLFLVSKNMLSRVLAVLFSLVFLGALWALNSVYFLTLIPAAINLMIFIAFLHSYFQPPTIPAKFAAKVHATMSDARIVYCNKLTLIWCMFFLTNASISIYTALYCSQEVWALYNGLISYLLMGSIFVAEFAFRVLVFNKNHE